MLESEATPQKLCKIPYSQTMARCSTAGHPDAWMRDVRGRTLGQAISGAYPFNMLSCHSRKPLLWRARRAEEKVTKRTFGEGLLCGGLLLYFDANRYGLLCIISGLAQFSYITTCIAFGPIKDAMASITTIFRRPPWPRACCPSLQWK